MPVYPSGGTIAQSVGSPGFGPAPTPSYNASASVRLNPADTAYFSYTPTLNGSRTTWTWSGWVKRSAIGTPNYQELFGTPNGTANTTFAVLTFGSNGVTDSLGFQGYTSTYRTTTQVFRDPAQWYHILCAVDTTQSTGANRVKLYVNGTQITAFSTSADPAQFAQLPINAAGAIHTIGRDLQQSVNFGGYLADVNFVDGLALTPSSFTSTDANTGQLVPIQYTGAFGINGFYLPFNSAALAVDLGQNKKVINQDGYWPYNTLLVNTTSTNGQQNNDFVNESQFAVSVPMTRVGNTTQGNFSPFAFGGGTTQADGYYSGYFDGTGDYLNCSPTALGTGNFTIECYVLFSGTSVASEGVFHVATASVLPSAVQGVAVASGASGGWTLYYNNGSQSTNTSLTAVLNTWTHVAVVRNSGTIYLYINGVLNQSQADTANYTNTNAAIGGFYSTGFLMQGNISNFRIVNSAIYSGTSTSTPNFTVPTTPLTAIANTLLLTCQSSQFIDNSANAFTITANGNSQPQPTNPFGMTAWSGYFDGAGDYLTLASSAGLAMETGNFTWELWVYQQSSTGFRTFIDTRTGSGNLGLFFGTNTGTTNLYIGNDTTALITASASFDLNQWNHVALVRSSGTLTAYLNGVSVGTASYSANMTNTTGYIACSNNLLNQYVGYVSNVRMVKGTAVYTSNFTPPTAPLTAISGTSLLTCQSSTFVDSSPNAVAITTNGNPYTLTLTNPFGNPINYTTPPVQAWSTYHAASGDTLSLSQTALTALSSSNAWTIEFWAYKAASSAVTYSTVLSTDISGNSSGTVFSFNNTTFACGGQGHAGFPIQYTPAGSVSLNQWYHFAIVKNNGVLKIYINGIEQVSVTQSTTFPNIGQPLRIGNRNNGDTPFIGYVSNIRFVNGRAVYTSNFTPPTSPLSVIGNTTLLTCQSNRLVDNSLNNFVITKAGNANVSPVTPFFPIQTYSAASNGGAMYFDGTGDYLNIIKSSFLAGTQDFTFQAWIYPTSTNTGTVCGFGANTPTGYCGLNWRITSTTMQTYWSTNGTTETLISGGAIKQNVWQHVAATRSGSTIRLFLDGAQVGTGTVSGALYTGSVANGALNSYTIGCYFSSSAPSSLFTGYISSFEYLNGVSRYNTPFTPPVLPQTAANLTTVLLNATNSGIYDATGQNVIETAGNAQVSTAVKKWGTSSVFFDGSGDYLVIPPTNAPCQFGTTDFTIEAWIYSTSIANQQIILSNRIAATGTANFDFQIVTSKLLFGTTNTNLLTGTITLSSNTWYHVAVSRVSGTARMFVNGVLDTSTTTSFNLSNNSVTHVGTNGTYAPTQYPFIGYMQDVRVSKVGRYSGAFTPPTAAFAYNVQEIGYQQWTPTNISVTAGINQDNLVDSPSDYGTDTGLGGQVRGNYATLNPLLGTGTLSNGNLQYAGIVGDATRPATIGVSSGKWYAEFNVNSALGTTVTMGIAVYDQTAAGTSNASQSRGYFYTGQKYSNGSLAAYGNSFTNGDVIGVALDLDAGKVWFSKNGVFQASGDPVAGTNAAYTDLGTTSTWFVSIQSGGSAGTSASAFLNAGQRAFAYTAPTGFKCLVSTNLPTTNNIGATSSTQATDYFNPTIWTGNGSQVDVGFNPELLWYKARNAVDFGGVVDVLRGDTKYLQTYSTNAEGTQAGLLTTNSTGFVPGSAFSTNNYVAWNWKANGAGVTNTAGSITSTVSANTTSGFSVVTYTGTGVNATVGHGLSVAPDMMIVKCRTQGAGYNWAVYHKNIGATKVLLLNSTSAEVTASAVWNNTAPTTTVFSIGTDAALNGSTQTYVAYCFAPVAGYSAFGSYTGNGSSTQGAFVYTGFRPAFVMIKASSFAADWVVYDDARNPSNLTNLLLRPNTSAVEATGVGTVIDMVSNGFLPRNAGTEVNQASATYVYAAFAEFPFKYSRAR